VCEIWHVFCRMLGVGTGVLVLYAMSTLICLDLWQRLMFVDIICTCTVSL